MIPWQQLIVTFVIVSILAVGDVLFFSEGYSYTRFDRRVGAKCGVVVYRGVTNEGYYLGVRYIDGDILKRVSRTTYTTTKYDDKVCFDVYKDAPVYYQICVGISTMTVGVLILIFIIWGMVEWVDWVRNR